MGGIWGIWIGRVYRSITDQPAYPPLNNTPITPSIHHTDPRPITSPTNALSGSGCSGGWRALAVEARRWCSSSAGAAGGGAVVLVPGADGGGRWGMCLYYLCVVSFVWGL